MYDGRIAAYGLSLRPGLSQTKRMLGAAFSLGYDLKGLMFHSDQGWQYQHRRYVESPKRRGILRSMSREGNCLDNCIMESFFGTMKNEMYCGRQAEYGSFETFAKAVGEYIAWCNGTRIRYQKYMKKMDDPFGLLRGKLRWTSVRSVVMMVPIQSSKLGTHQIMPFCP